MVVCMRYFKTKKEADAYAQKQANDDEFGPYKNDEDYVQTCPVIENIRVYQIASDMCTPDNKTIRKLKKSNIDQYNNVNMKRAFGGYEMESDVGKWVVDIEYKKGY